MNILLSDHTNSFDPDEYEDLILGRLNAYHEVFFKRPAAPAEPKSQSYYSTFAAEQARGRDRGLRLAKAMFA